MSRPPLRSAAAVLRDVVEWDGVDALRRCEAPLLFVLSRLGGSNDPPRLLAHKPDIDIGVTVGAGHFNQLVVPEQVNAMIERFLNVRVRHPAARAPI